MRGEFLSLKSCKYKNCLPVGALAKSGTKGITETYHDGELKGEAWTVSGLRVFAFTFRIDAGVSEIRVIRRQR